jgi:uncharacterized membrane protein YgaE (UPF0421/DUF939 family)
MVTQTTLSELGTRSKRSVFARVRRVRGTLLLALQAGVAAGLAWYIAHGLLHRPQPFFAPIAAVIVLNVSVGQKLRRGVELLVGVATGILVGDAVIYVIGTGFFQIALIVSAAVATAAFLGGSPTLIGQAASSGVLVATVTVPGGGIYYSRFVDALIGGVTGLLVMVLLLQVNPLTVVSRATGPALGAIADALAGAADALAADDQEAGQAVLDELDRRTPVLGTFHDRLDEARETSRLAPVRWRTQAPLARYLNAAPQIERALHNARVLVRRSLNAVRDAEDVPADLVAAVRTMAQALRQLERELAAGHEPVRTQELAVVAATLAGVAYRRGVGFHGSVVVAQLRAIATDLLVASGRQQKDAEKTVRRAAGRRGSGERPGEPSQPPVR